jgi:sec-independent protein translocase protein TatA
MPFNLGGPELIIVLVIVLIVFGAGKLPGVMRDVGKGVKEFKKAQTDEEVAAQMQSTAAPAAGPAAAPAAPAPPVANGTAPAPAARPAEPAPRA